MSAYKHDSLLKCWRTQWFLTGPQVAVYSHDLADDSDMPVFALYSRRQFKKLKDKPEADHTERPWKKRSLPKMAHWAIREYVRGWKTQLAKPIECGCRVFRGTRYIYCSADHMFKELVSG